MDDEVEYTVGGQPVSTERTVTASLLAAYAELFTNPTSLPLYLECRRCIITLYIRGEMPPNTKNFWLKMIDDKFVPDKGDSDDRD